MKSKLLKIWNSWLVFLVPNSSEYISQLGKLITKPLPKPLFIGHVMRILFSILVTCLLVACGKTEQVTKDVIRPIDWLAVTPTKINQIRTLSGIVASVEATSLSFEVNGKVDKVLVNLGNKVKKGQELARLNQQSFNLSLQSSQAQLDQAKASYAEANAEYKRYQQLVEEKLVSRSGFDNAKAAFESSKSAVDLAQAQLNIVKKNRQDSILIAPYDGIITKRMIEPSQQIGAGQSSFEIEGTHGLEVKVMVPETLIQELKQDAILSVRFPVLPNFDMQGQITEIGTRAESANAFPVTVLLQSQLDKLRAGMTAEVDFTFTGTGRTGYQGLTVSVPVTALLAGLEQKAYVFVYLPEQGIVEKRQVQTEDMMNNKIYISEGLKEGEIIAIAGVSFLRDGQKVTLLDKQTQRFN